MSIFNSKVQDLFTKVNHPPVSVHTGGFSQLFKVGNGNNQYTHSHARKVKEHKKEVDKLLITTLSKHGTLEESTSEKGTHTSTTLKSRVETAKASRAAHNALIKAGYKEISDVKGDKGNTSTATYTHENGHTVQITRPKTDKVSPAIHVVSHKVKDDNPAPAKDKTSVKPEDLVSTLGSNAKVNTANPDFTSVKLYTTTAGQKEKLSEVHTQLKEHGYHLGKTASIDKNNLETKYSHPDNNDISVEYHTEGKASSRGGKVNVKLHDTKSGGTGLDTTPHVAAPEKKTSPAPKLKGLNLDKDDTAFSKFAKDHAGNIDELSEDQRASIQEYTSSSYDDINTYLRGKSEGRAVIKKYADHILSALQQNSIGMDIQAFRGVSGNTGAALTAAGKAGTLVGTTIANKGITSLTTSKDFAKMWASNYGKTKQPVIHIELSAKQKGLYVASISYVSGEKEILLPPNVKMLVTHYKETPSGAPEIFVKVVD